MQRNAVRPKNTWSRPVLERAEQRLLFAGESTYFIDGGSTFNGMGDWWTQRFTVPTSGASFELRFAADYKADCVVAKTSYESAFKSNSPVSSAYAAFDDAYGTKSLKLPGGTYFVGARNQVNGANDYRFELDTKLVPLNAAYSGQGVPVTARTVGKNGGKLWQPFTVQSGFRYFVDGCNTGVSTYVIPANQLGAFQSGSTFSYYTDYSGTDKALPGLDEIKLSPGSYYLAFVNDASVDKAITYSMDVFRNVSSGGIKLTGSWSWRTSGNKISISVGKIANTASSGTSGSLRLRVWATLSPYTGEAGLSGYVLGTANLDPLKAGYAYNSLTQSVSYTKPAAGRYYTVVTVEEYTGSGWVIRGYSSSTTRTKF